MHFYKESIPICRSELLALYILIKTLLYHFLPCLSSVPKTSANFSLHPTNVHYHYSEGLFHVVSQLQKGSIQ